MQISYETEQRLKCSKFSTGVGVDEYFFTATSNDGISFNDAIDEITELYKAALQENHLDKTTLQFIRFYLSDITNDFPKLKDSSLFKMVCNGAISLVGQTPVNGGPLGIIVYHIKSKDGSFCLNSNSCEFNPGSQNVHAVGKNYSLLWSTRLADKSVPDSEVQTNRIFDETKLVLQRHQMTIEKNTIRTWIYCRDVDNNYSGMVKARRELFTRIGLTEKTRYIASTGIEGQAVDPHQLIFMDALSVGNIKEEQIVRMEAPENLSSTHHYGVTFERGTRVRYGDRSHIYISGTASIDPLGNILYVGDVRNQVERTLDNVEALLSHQGAVLADMQYLILYMRDSKHYPLIEDILSSRIPENVPLMIVDGPVCRPGWLVEIEGVGIISDKNDFPVFE